jgi:hypothetical protein
MKENEMKKWLCVPVILLALSCHAIDLTGGDVVGVPTRCITPAKEIKMCVLVAKYEKHYKVVFDEKGEYEIYEVVVEDKGTHYQMKSEKLLWSRNSI